jgi:hypothetical protein
MFDEADFGASDAWLLRVDPSGAQSREQADQVVPLRRTEVVDVRNTRIVPSRRFVTRGQGASVPLDVRERPKAVVLQLEEPVSIARICDATFG